MSFIQPLIDIVFPATCVCCGTSTHKNNRYLCGWCSISRFESASDSEQELLPEKVRFAYSMWQFDKGGYLQDLLHNLKYNYLRGVGNELGYLAGLSFIEKTDADTLQYLDAANPLLVPVPLHKSKQRQRGYNQARALAEGLSGALGWEIISQKAVIRARKTKTQTGLNAGQRTQNLKNAFITRKPEELQDRFAVIVDDVYTTGATAFELASTICGDSRNCGIITIARV